MRYSHISRRAFVQSSTVATVHAAWPMSTRNGGPAPHVPSSLDPVPAITLRDPRARALALAAVDAARSAGATYADVRITNTMSWSASLLLPSGGGGATLGLSVRALINGQWGWAATPTLTIDEGVRVARLATQFATTAAAIRARAGRAPAVVDLGAMPSVHEGDWHTPVTTDPFTVDFLDLHEWCYGVGQTLKDRATALRAPASVAWTGVDDLARNNGIGVFCGANFEKQECVFASTEGSFFTRTVIITHPSVGVIIQPYGTPVYAGTSYFNRRVQAGLEYLLDPSLIDRTMEAVEQAYAAPPPPPPKHLDIGRYDCVFSAGWMAQLLCMTLAPALHPDRILGYEASATGTSYLGTDPLAVLGTPVAGSNVTITAERSNPIGIATVPWDDEGVVPTDVPLVTAGVLTNCPTTRESAGWVAPWLQQQGRLVQSFGCARAPTALEPPMLHTPNLVLHPGAGHADEASLVGDLEHGLHFTTLPGGYTLGSFAPRVDWQCQDVYDMPVFATEIRRGKPVGVLSLSSTPQMAMLFKSNEFWKNIEALGGPASAEYLSDNGFGEFGSYKGTPVQGMTQSVGAVPARVKQLAFINSTER